jgi:hypothetical protein
MRFKNFTICCLVAAGVVATATVQSSAQTQVGSLRGENKGIALMFYSMPTGFFCVFPRMQLAHQIGGGRYMADDEINLINSPAESVTWTKALPSILVMPPGRYGIVSISCSGGNRTAMYSAKMTERKNIFTATGNIYDTPIVEFTVRTGEVADIGLLQIHSTGRETFNASVAPMPEQQLRNLAEFRSDLYKAKVSRPMVRGSTATR